MYTVRPVSLVSHSDHEVTLNSTIFYWLLHYNTMASRRDQTPSPGGTPESMHRVKNHCGVVSSVKDNDSADFTGSLPTTPSFRVKRLGSESTRASFSASTSADLNASPSASGEGTHLLVSPDTFTSCWPTRKICDPLPSVEYSQRPAHGNSSNSRRPPTSSCCTDWRRTSNAGRTPSPSESQTAFAAPSFFHRTPRSFRYPTGAQGALTEAVPTSVEYRKPSTNRIATEHNPNTTASGGSMLAWRNKHTSHTPYDSSSIPPTSLTASQSARTSQTAQNHRLNHRTGTSAATSHHKHNPFHTTHAATVTNQQQQQFINLLLSTIHSLYEDELRPTLAEVRRRLQEHRLPSHWLRDLSAYCAALRHELRFDPRSQDILLVHQPPNFRGFVDPKSPHDPFPCCVWREFKDYITWLVCDPDHLQNNLSSYVQDYTGVVNDTFNSVDTPSIASARKSGRRSVPALRSDENDGLLHYQFQGGRYGMAIKMRKDWRLQYTPRLRQLSTARLCHLIQLSIAYGIMQYENNILQPRATCLRIGAAFAQSDLEPERAATNREAIRDAEAVKASLNALLQDEPHGLLLSQLKFAFEQRLSSRLCQSVFGCTRLSNLLQLPVFQSTCRIIGDAQSRVFVQSTRFPIPAGMRQLTSSNKPQATAELQATQNAESSESCTEQGNQNTTLRMAQIPLSSCCSITSLNISFQHWKQFRESFPALKSIPKTTATNDTCWTTAKLDTPNHASRDQLLITDTWMYNERGTLCYFRHPNDYLAVAAPSPSPSTQRRGCAVSLFKAQELLESLGDSSQSLPDIVSFMREL